MNLSEGWISQFRSVSQLCLTRCNPMDWGHTRLPCCSAGKESACNVGDLGSIPGLGRSPGEGNGYPPQYSCLENSMDKGAWQAVWGHKELDTTK